ncbi:MAG: amidohydrolase [Phascolarctobacterium sp.]|nr:amidohydrolase [Phascolarctobacterium sp.]
MSCKFEGDIEKILPKVSAWRRHMHRNPEPSFEEFSTTEYIIENLKNVPGITMERLAETGVVVRLDTGKPGPTIALRADIDALRMPELTEVEFKSQKEGIMHACGHDTHTAMLMGVVHIMAERVEELEGKFVFIFQAAEEDPPGGAQELVAKGVLQGVDAIIGQHNASMGTIGTIELCPGYYMANSDRVDIRIVGKGGHGARPEDAFNPLPAGAQIVNSLYHIIPNTVFAHQAAVLTVTVFQGGTSHNIIPDECKISATVRTYENEVREHIKAKINEVAQGIASIYGVKAEVNYQYGYDALYNTPEYTEAVIETAKEVLGENSVVICKPRMGGEDFAYYLKEVPGCFYHIGFGVENPAERRSAHNSHYIIDEAGFANGLKMMINGAIKFQSIVKASK